MQSSEVLRKASLKVKSTGLRPCEVMTSQNRQLFLDSLIINIESWWNPGRGEGWTGEAMTLHMTAISQPLSDITGITTTLFSLFFCSLWYHALSFSFFLQLMDFVFQKNCEVQIILTWRVRAPSYAHSTMWSKWSLCYDVFYKSHTKLLSNLRCCCLMAHFISILTQVVNWKNNLGFYLMWILLSLPSSNILQKSSLHSVPVLKLRISLFVQKAWGTFWQKHWHLFITSEQYFLPSALRVSFEA